MAEKKVVLTYDGLKQKEDELYDLKINRRKDVAEKIKEARSQGDLSENAEYDAAKEEQAEIEAKIVQIEKMLRNAEVIDEDEIDKNKVNVGVTVKIFDYEFDEEVSYTIVGSAEADPMNGKISNESPIGLAMIGHGVDDEITVDSPQGEIKIKILEIK